VTTPFGSTAEVPDTVRCAVCGLWVETLVFVPVVGGEVCADCARDLEAGILAPLDAYRGLY
jgi:hypothetical protein